MYENCFLTDVCHNWVQIYREVGRADGGDDISVCKADFRRRSGGCVPIENEEINMLCEWLAHIL